MMSTSPRYVSKMLTIENPEGRAPEELLGVRRYLADGWLIVEVTVDGGAITVDMVKALPDDGGPLL